MINFEMLKNSLPNMLQGAWLSCEIATLALCIGLIGGTLLALALLYGNPVIRAFAHVYTTLFRGTPMLMQMFAFYFVLPYVGIVLPAFLTAVIVIGFNSIAYLGQIIRAGIQAVSAGQVEAAKVLGFSGTQITRYVVLPQALRTVFPAIGGECITLMKDSSLASVIGVAELTHQGSIIMSRSYDALTTYFGVAIFYLCMTSVVSLILHAIERKINHVKN